MPGAQHRKAFGPGGARPDAGGQGGESGFHPAEVAEGLEIFTGDQDDFLPGAPLRKLRHTFQVLGNDLHTAGGHEKYRPGILPEGFLLQQLFQLGANAEDQIRIRKLHRKDPGTARPAGIQHFLLRIVHAVLSPEIDEGNVVNTPEHRPNAEEGAVLSRGNGLAVLGHRPGRCELV